MRAITLDPLASGPVPVEAHRVESSLACGFRQSWIDGKGTAPDGTEVEFSLTCGAGVGSPYLILSVDGRGEEIVNMADVVQEWIGGLLSREEEGNAALAARIEEAGE